MFRDAQTLCPPHRRPNLTTTLQCAHFAAFHRLPSQPTKVVDQRPSRGYIARFTDAGDMFIGEVVGWLVLKRRWTTGMVGDAMRP